MINRYIQFIKSESQLQNLSARPESAKRPPGQDHAHSTRAVTKNSPVRRACFPKVFPF